MKYRILSMVGAAAIAVSAAVGQSASSAPPDALALLQQVSQRYADAKTYHIKSIEESTEIQELAHYWSKSILDAAETPNGRHRFEARSSMGSGLSVSDGKTSYVYDGGAHLYTQTAVSSAAPSNSSPKRPSLMELSQAQALRDSLTHLAKGYKSATQLPDEVITIEGHQVACAVVRVGTSDLKKQRSNELSLEEMFWIDKSKMTVVRRIERQRSYAFASDEVHIPMYVETVIVYPLTDLEFREPDATFFSFTPPQDAKLVEAFPDLKHRDLVGKTAPSLSLKTADGKVVSLDSFHGKPVLIDFWATWCSPCVESMPQLAHLYQQTKDKGLIFLTIDKDEDGKDATDFLAKRSYTWVNLHDDGAGTKAFGEHFGIPRTILVNATGKIVYDKSGYREDEILAAVAGLGPEYAFMSPNPKPEPCGASNRPQ